MNDVNIDSLLAFASNSTPRLLLDFDVIDATYTRFETLFNGGQVFYAVKANATPSVLELVVNRGGGLEIASLAELELSLRVGATGDRIICSNPIKNPTFLRRMVEENVYAMVADSVYEVEKIAQHAPGARVYFRLAVDNTGSVLPLSGKFGVSAQQALELADMARDLGLNPIGVSFHVGSQCLSPMNWVNAIRACGDVWREAQARGHDFYLLNLGGGYPAGHYHTAAIPTLDEIAALVNDAVRDYIPHTPNLMLVLEPGRGLVGESGVLLATIEGRAVRGTEEWVYLDAGVFNGLMETYEGFPPVVRVLSHDADTRPVETYTLAGPSCDSCDVVARSVEMPQLRIGDKLAFLDSGAYVTEYGAAFNGFPTPELVLLNVRGRVRMPHNALVIDLETSL